MHTVSAGLPETRTNNQAKEMGRKRRILAAALSASVPGTGHFLLNKKAHAIGFLFAFAALGLLYWPVRAPKAGRRIKAGGFFLRGFRV
jgi:hypothetical protein